MAPVIPPRASEPPAAAAPAPRASEPPAVVTPAAAPAGKPLTATNENPLRKQTLLGMAPIIPAAVAVPATEPAVDPAPSVASIVTPAAIATDAPTTTDVPEAPVVEAKPRRAEPTPAPAALSSSHDDLPELQPRRPRWMLPLGVAAALALGVVGLRKLDRAPTPLPAELAKPVSTAKAPAAAAAPSPMSDEDDDGHLPSTGTEPNPDPRPTEPEPLAAKGTDAKTGDDIKTKTDDTKPVEDAKPAAAPSAVSAPAPAGSIIRINIDSDPPGARMFWKGKEQGTTPFVLEFQAGERHAYELGLPGYMTRKVVIDGSKTDISIGLRPDPVGAAGASPRK